MYYSTRTVGDGTLVQKRVVAKQYAVLAALVGFNNGADLYIQIHETAAEPSAGAVPLFHFLAVGTLPYSFALPCAVNMSAITVVASSTLATYTASAGTPVSIQAIITG
jgi:hypothetical protein